MFQDTQRVVLEGDKQCLACARRHQTPGPMEAWSSMPCVSVPGASTCASCAWQGLVCKKASKRKTSPRSTTGAPTGLKTAFKTGTARSKSRSPADEDLDWLYEQSKNRSHARRLPSEEKVWNTIMDVRLLHEGDRRCWTCQRKGFDICAQVGKGRSCVTCYMFKCEGCSTIQPRTVARTKQKGMKRRWDERETSDSEPLSSPDDTDDEGLATTGELGEGGEGADTESGHGGKGRGASSSIAQVEAVEKQQVTHKTGTEYPGAESSEDEQLQPARGQTSATSEGHAVPVETRDQPTGRVSLSEGPVVSSHGGRVSAAEDRMVAAANMRDPSEAPLNTQKSAVSLLSVPFGAVPLAYAGGDDRQGDIGASNLQSFHGENSRLLQVPSSTGGEDHARSLTSVRERIGGEDQAQGLASVRERMEDLLEVLIDNECVKTALQAIRRHDSLVSTLTEGVLLRLEDLRRAHTEQGPTGPAREALHSELQNLEGILGLKRVQATLAAKHMLKDMMEDLAEAKRMLATTFS